MYRMSWLLMLCIFTAAVLSASPASFCKCTCFTNSTIIKLGPEHAMPSKTPPTTLTPPSVLFSRAAISTSCSVCNKAFCLSYNLPICKDAEEKDVVTSCFQRDSTKDQIIVLLFCTVTGGLLGWAAVKKALEMRNSKGVQVDPGQYAPISERDRA